MYSSGAVTHGLIKSCTGLLEITLHTSLILLRFALILIQAINLFSQFSHRVVMLGAESSKSSFVGNVSLLKFSLKLGKLSFALLVKFNLGASVGANLGKTTTKILNVAGKEGSVLLRLGAVSTFDSQLLVKFLKTRLKLLDLLGIFATKSLFIFNLGSKASHFLLLPLHSLRGLVLDAIQVSDSFLSKLQVTFNLALHLLSIPLGFLLTLQSIFTFIKRLLELSLHLAQMIATILGRLNVFLGLLATLTNRLLVFGQLGNQILLVGNFLTKGADLVVLGHLVLLAFFNSALQFLNLTTEANSFSCDLSSSLVNAANSILLSFDSL